MKKGKKNKSNPKKTNNKLNKLLLVLLLLAAFIGGRLWTKIKEFSQEGKVAPRSGEKDVTSEEVILFSPSQKEKPKIDFFVMSFCPYGNQAENGLAPVADLLGSKIEWQPHYIVSKVNLKQKCEAMTYTPQKCQDYVAKEYFPDLAACKKNLYPNLVSCRKKEREKLLMTGREEGFSSLHGRGELNQDIREICAWNLVSDKKKWWQFVLEVNRSCQPDNADQCWEEKARKAGLNIQAIKKCFRSQAITLLEKEVTATEKYQVRGSPTVFINDLLYPPENAYRKGAVLKMAGFEKSFTSSEYRSSEAYKEAICAAFSDQPDQCRKVFSQNSGSQTNGGGCR